MRKSGPIELKDNLFRLRSLVLPLPESLEKTYVNCYVIKYISGQVDRMCFCYLEGLTRGNRKVIWRCSREVNYWMEVLREENTEMHPYFDELNRLARLIRENILSV